MRRRSSPIFLVIFLLLGVGSFVSARAKAGRYERDFMQQCNGHYNQAACEATVRMDHDSCVRQATPRRRHGYHRHSAFYVSQPQRGEYLDCMMKKVRSKTL